MNYIQYANDRSINPSVIDEVDSGYISYNTLPLLIDADENQEDLKWLELNLVAIERYVKQGRRFEIQSEFDTITISSKNEFYLWCNETLPHSYNLFLQNRHY